MNSREIAEMRFKILALRRAGNTDGAIRACKQYLEGNPSDCNVRHQLAMALFTTGDVDDAIAHCRMTVAMKPNSVMHRSLLINLLEKQGRWDESLAQATALVERGRNAPLGHLHIGRALEMLSDIDGAINAYEAAGRSGSLRSYDLLTLANLYDRVGRNADAFDARRQSSTGAAGEMAAHLWSAGIYAKSGALGEARNAWNRVVTVGENAIEMGNSVPQIVEHLRSATAHLGHAGKSERD